MFTGSWAALVTPMQTDGSIDTSCLGKLLEWHISQGTDGIVVNGTTGESPTLEVAEQQEILRFSLDCVNRRIPVLMGTGCNATQRTIARTVAAFEQGVDGCLIVTPYYNKPTQEGLYQHYRAIAQSAIGPIVIYNVPGRTSCDIQPSTVKRLMEFSNIVGVKEAWGNKDRYAELVQQCAGAFDILSGDDATALELLRLGGHGVISVTANVAPHAVSQMCRAARAGDWTRAEKLEQQLAALNHELFVESNPIPVKWALQHMGMIGAGIRLPLTPLSEIYHAQVKQALSDCKNA